MGDKNKGPLSVTYSGLRAADVDAQYCFYVSMDRGTVLRHPDVEPVDNGVYDQQVLRSTAFSVMDRGTPMWTGILSECTEADTAIFPCFPDVRMLGFSLPTPINPALSHCGCGWMGCLTDFDMLRFPVLVDKRIVWIPEPYSPKFCVSDFYVELYVTWLQWDEYIKEQHG